MDTSVNYMGLSLEHPIMVGASPLTMDAPSIQRCAEAGASAVVMKSLFEEQISHETATLSQSLLAQENMHAEVFSYLEARIGMRYGAREYLQSISQARNAVEIPVIASLNCASIESWRELAQELESAGADALELNISIFPAGPEISGRRIEEQFIEIIAAARSAVQLPLAVKFGQQFSCLPEMAARSAAAGADACIIFNRPWTPAVDIDNESIFSPQSGSVAAELNQVLRWVAMLAERTGGQICAGTGIHDGAGVVQALLAGADCVQVVSAPLFNGRQVIGEMVDTLREWMRGKGYLAIEDFRGKLSQARNPQKALFSRMQYMDALGTSL